jgi:hypothetical protein
VTGGKELKNVIVADYTNLRFDKSLRDGVEGQFDPEASGLTIEGENVRLGMPDGSDWPDDLSQSASARGRLTAGCLTALDESVRERIEDVISGEVATQVISRLPRNTEEMEALIRAGYYTAERMSWDVVVKKHLLNSLQKALHKQRTKISTPHPE